MRHPKKQMTSGEDLFVRIDLHKHRWHVTIRTVDLELFSPSIPGTWEALQRVLARYHGHPLQAVYEAGYFGFLLHDRMAASPIVGSGAVPLGPRVPSQPGKTGCCLILRAKVSLRHRLPPPGGRRAD